jgi:predicted 3-demethylubiquinone-9 3-methyltransferase (glyoxalase superfamily)
MEFASKIVPCLWFDQQGEDAARFYTGIFPNSKIGTISRYGETGREITGGQPGKVLTVSFELDGQQFTALNGGPMFKFNEAISLQILCDTQEEIDHYWSRLNEGGDPSAQQCGWLKDRFGLSWQVTPKALLHWITDPDRARSERTFAAMLKMKKLDIAPLQRAYEGK